MTKKKPELSIRTKTFPGGNDYEIFSDPSVNGHTVTSQEDTVKQLNELFFSKA